MISNRDRSLVAAQFVANIVAESVRAGGTGFHRKLADFLRVEFDEVAQQTLSEIRRRDE